MPDATLVPLDEAIRRADIIVLGAPHSAYHDLKFSPDKVVIDIWNFWPERRETEQPAVAAAAGAKHS